MDKQPKKYVYAIPKPTHGLQVWFYGVVMFFGLIYLFIAAYEAFGQVMDNLQAFFGAGLIETGVIVASISYAKGKGRRALIEIIVSLLVSGTYNYIQVSSGGIVAGITDSWQVLTLALGPLISMVFISTLLGGELQDHDAAVEGWEIARQAYLELQIDADRVAETKRESRRLLSDERIAKVAAVAGKLPESAQVAEQVAVLLGKLPECLGKVQQGQTWKSLAKEQKISMAGMSAAELRAVFPWLKDRSSSNWSRWAVEVQDLASAMPTAREQAETSANGRTPAIGGK